MKCWAHISRGLGGALDGLRRVVPLTLVMVGFGGVALAQVPTLTEDQLQQLQVQRGGTAASQSAISPREMVLEPTAPSTRLQTSNLEQILSTRAGVSLQQYGYDQLGIGRSVTLPQVGAVQDEYILGVGDEIVLTLRGQENAEYRGLVDRDGNVTFPRLPPRPAAGRSFGQFRQDVVNAIHRSFVSTEGFVTVGRLRQISVLVSGEVGSPGVRTLTGLSTVIDAVFTSGGIKKSGSLRNVRILRDGRELTVDLYSVLIGGVRSKNVTLTNGDKIIIPPIGATVAVAGETRRPGIYELPPGRTSIGVREAVALASGTSVSGNYRVSLLRTLPNGKRQLVDITGSSDISLRDSEILFVRSTTNISLNQVSLVGAVRTPGMYALGKYKTLRDILPSSESLQPGAYVLFGIVEHIDATTLQRTAIPFSPLAVIQGKANRNLSSDDVVHVFSKSGMCRLIDLVSTAMPNGTLGNAGGNTSQTLSTGCVSAAETEGTTTDRVAALAAGLTPVKGGATTGLMAGGTTPGTDNAARGGPAGTASGTDNAARGGSTGAAPDVDNAARAAGLPPAAATPNTIGDLDGFQKSEAMFLAKTIADYRVVVSGAVRDPGVYPVFPGTPISDLLNFAGGFLDDADLTNFELTSTVIENATGKSTTSRETYPATPEVFNRIGLKAYDRLVFRSVYSDKAAGMVSVSGEVRYPGTFDVLRSERLSSLLRRAGGFTEVAYPEGAVFLRASVATAEGVESARIANDLRSQLLQYATKPQQANTQPLTAETILALQALIAQQSNTPALGRVPVVANLSELEKHPELDITLEPGDSVVIPRVPSTVLVMGEVMRPGAARFIRSHSVDDYIDMSGGTTDQADTSRIIVVLPDGSVRTNGSSWLNFGLDSDIPAGSTVFVPRNLNTTEFRQILTDSIQIVSQLATTAAALAVLSKQ